MASCSPAISLPAFAVALFLAVGTGWAATDVGLATEGLHHTAGGGEGVRLNGYLQLWWTALEEVENGLRQPLTGDEGAQEASGFSVRRARLSAGFGGRDIRGRVVLRLEGSPPGLLDAYAVVPLVGRRVELWGGQMKVPSTYEVGIPGARLDFITRSCFSQRVVDFSLCRSPVLSSPRFYGVRTYLRDLGVALKGEALGAKYFLMVGNGLGANSFIGGWEKKQDVFANRVGAYLYAARFSLGTLREDPPEDGRYPSVALQAGGHASWNNHADIVLDDERTVLDIRRRSWSADVHADVLDALRFTVMYGEGSVEDDFDNDGRTDYRYRGWEFKAIAGVPSEAFRLGFRYDVFADEWYESGEEDLLRSYVVGATYEGESSLRLQLNYKWKVLESEVNPDLDDDLLAIAAQVGF